MLEIGLAIAVCVIMTKVAIADDQSAVIWAFVTIALCVLSFGLPWPFLRLLIAGIASFTLMFGYKLIAER